MTKFPTKKSALFTYADLLGQIKTRIQQGQTRAVMSANAEMISMYWEIGCLLDEQQKERGWGARVIPRLSKDIHNELPEVKGFSERNLKRMIAFYRTYPAFQTIVPQAVAQLAPRSKMPHAVAQIHPNELILSLPWGHHFLLIEKVEDHETRFWYMQQVLEQGWGRDTLSAMIKSSVHKRQGKLTSNFKTHLPLPQSELVEQTLKDPYIFDFMTLAEPFHERELETGLVKHLEKFLIELGQGFAFVGRQYHVEVSDKDFYIDLLFYHLKLRSYVVIELKKGPFKPEYAGKMNFYCSVVDDKIKTEADNPTIGLILCQDRDRILAEYSLRDINKPIGVSGYELTQKLPAKLQSSLPSIKQIEAELSATTKTSLLKKKENKQQRIT
ncbi:MAG: hypothetical protein A3G32_09600 [Deltaproteobacteria bacterium RIFCSPLOWO2_12_FULL_40_28]|nr:MAG: hypothetical protein A3C45_07870 [Deltaproteobacteria bacterium RIFCSPHIGHO2_02_FULL_40_28]OGQ20537.1 MAG: hypothetical protein A3E27_02660 [Deltaproteobacteria bacterium RIFCSPHIGHO2_12_FULL_40_32]OGQ41188.1 MAG: hypothetical protein A3I69_07895 [Deltaproteobacteria bacterium RIFCSPLOWO2_02_FULL_40_36]OGQ55150.1 MAG: hypothetical protein A3G32_09600 [Deltaproteobacteria bacterium RIFCSPLOWO2_12_FULL_40_28]